SEEAFGWTAFGEPEAPPEPAPPEKEAPPAEAPTVEEITPLPEAAAPEVVIEEPVVAPPSEEAFGWTAFGEPEAPPEPAPPEEITPPPVVERLEPPEMVIPLPEEIAPPPVIEEAPDAAEVEMIEPVEEVVAEPETLTVEAPAESFEAKRAYLKENSRDYDAWLAFAQALWQADEHTESLEAYSRMIRSSKLIENVILDLEGYMEQWPDVHLQQVLGDAYMKDGQLQAALDLYRQALETL
ncbi:MAG: hypothetical protein U9R15_05140, partial [Chloroflexota bacterium]|nr:hypothetical protein [Chloroflexota bacterium]